MKLTWKLTLPIPASWNTPEVIAKRSDFVGKMINLAYAAQQAAALATFIGALNKTDRRWQQQQQQEVRVALGQRQQRLVLTVLGHREDELSPSALECG
jgi:hypothetical protein